MRYRVYFQTQQPIEFWAREWEFVEHSTVTIRCWGTENMRTPSIDITFHEPPTVIQDLSGNTVWPVAVPQA
jgi:hypothetical protein